MSPDLYIKKWKQLHNGYEQRVLFLFYKENRADKNYVFKKIVVTDYLEENHLFPEVTGYICNEIMLKEQNETLIIKKGINALKNAFDTQFKEKLITESRLMLDNPKYYRGHVNLGGYKYVYFESFHKKYGMPNILDGGFGSWFVVENGSTTNIIANTTNIYDKKGKIKDLSNNGGKVYHFEYEDLWKLSIKEIVNGKANIFNYDKYQYFCSTPTYVNHPTNTNLYFEKKIDEQYFVLPEGYDNVQDLFDNYLNSEKLKNIANSYYDAIKNNCLHFSKIEKKKHVVFFEHERNYHCRVKIGIGKIANNEWHDWKSGQLKYLYRFTKGRPTWCNIYARELAYNVFGDVEGGKPIPYNKSADGLYKYFMQNNNDFIDIRNQEDGKMEDEEKDKIWEFINAGYYVIFCGEGHIDTGYPDNASPNIGQVREWTDPISYSYNADKKYVLVGAGDFTGYRKTVEGYGWAKKNNVGKFIYLGYLKKEY